MDITGAFRVATAVIVALGGGGAIVLALSNYIGKIWADRLMERDRYEHAKELAKLRADLAAEHSRSLEELRATMSMDITKRLGAHQDKVVLYRSVADIVLDMVIQLHVAQRENRLPADPASQVVLDFERKRLHAYAYLAMFAPQAVMDRYDAIIDHLLAVLGAETPFNFATVRELGLNMINEARTDLGIDPSPIEYRGQRQ